MPFCWSSLSSSGDCCATSQGFLSLDSGGADCEKLGIDGRSSVESTTCPFRRLEVVVSLGFLEVEEADVWPFENDRCLRNPTKRRSPCLRPGADMETPSRSSKLRTSPPVALFERVMLVGSVSFGRCSKICGREISESEVASDRQACSP